MWRWMQLQSSRKRSQHLSDLLRVALLDRPPTLLLLRPQTHKLMSCPHMVSKLSETKDKQSVALFANKASCNGGSHCKYVFCRQRFAIYRSLSVSSIGAVERFVLWSYIWHQEVHQYCHPSSYASYCPKRSSESSNIIKGRADNRPCPKREVSKILSRPSLT